MNENVFKIRKLNNWLKCWGGVSAKSLYFLNNVVIVSYNQDELENLLVYRATVMHVTTLR